MNGTEPRKTIGFLFNMCRIPGPCSVLAQYLTIVEIWSFNTLSIYFLKYARRREVDDKFDSFFDSIPPWYRSQSLMVRSTNFLEWCVQCKIPLQRLRIDMPPHVEKESHSMDLKKIQDLKKATNVYLKTFGESLLAIHLNFSTGLNIRITNFVATHFVLMVLQNCPNLVMLCLDGPLLKFSQSQYLAILKASQRCPLLRDWVFAGSTLLTSKDRCDLFFEHLGVKFGSGRVRQLVLNTGNVHCLSQHEKYTLGYLRDMEENKVLRISNSKSECNIYYWQSESEKMKFHDMGRNIILV